MENNKYQSVISYRTSVRTAAGWRSITVTARVFLSKSGKSGEVVEVLGFHGDGVCFYTSLTGLNRHLYNVGYIVAGELHLTKRISKCEVLQ